MTRRWAARVTGGFLVWLALVVVARASGADPDLGLAGLMVATVSVVLWLVVDAIAELRVPSWELLAAEPIRAPGQDTRFVALGRLVAGHRDARTPGDGLQRQLTGLVDQRLMARYGVSWRADPERARALLPDDLVALAEQRAPYPRMSTNEVETLLDRIEAL